MRGRPPKPLHLHVIEGTIHATKHRKRLATEPRPTGDLVDTPDDLSESQAAIWAYALRHAPGGLLKMLDASVLKVWVVAKDIHDRVSSEVGKRGVSGLVTEAGSGTPMQSPYVGILNRQAAIMIRAAAELGFSPASRGRVASDDRGPSDPTDGYFDT